MLDNVYLFGELHLNVAKMLREIVVTFQHSYKSRSCLGDTK